MVAVYQHLSLSMYDEHQGPKVENDTDNHTTFHAEDAPNTPRLDGVETKREKFSRLSKLNTGLYNGKWGDQTKIRSKDNKAIFDAVSGQLDLNVHQQQRGRQVLETLNIREIGRPIYLIVFSLCARVYNQDASDENRYHPNRSDANNPDRFLEVAEGLELRTDSINSVYNKLEGEV